MTRTAILLLLLTLLLGCGGDDDPTAPPADPPGGGGNDAVIIDPSEVTLRPGYLQTFTATVDGPTDTTVTWSIVEAPAGGNIRPDGIYTAPQGGGQFHVVAASTADPALTDTALVQIAVEWECAGPATDQTFSLDWSVTVDFTNRESTFEGLIGAAWDNGIVACDETNHFLGRLDRNGAVVGWSGRGMSGEWPDQEETYTGWHPGRSVPEDHAIAGNGPGQFRGPVDAAVGPAGSIYVCDTENANVTRLSNGGVHMTHWTGAGPDDPEFSNPTAVAVSDDAFVYVIDHYRNLHRFDQHGTWLATIRREDLPAGTTTLFCDLAIDADGYLYVTDSIGCVHRLDRELGYIGRWGFGDAYPCDLASPGGVAVGSDGAIYVLDLKWDDQYLLKKYDRDGVYLAGMDLVDYSGPSGIALDEDDNIYLTNEGRDELYRFRQVP